MGFIAFLLAVQPLKAQPPTNLSGIAFIIDPGHSDNENVGIYGYSEAYKVLDVAFHLREFLWISNVDTVLMTRTDRTTIVSITQRYTLANNLSHPNRWFHSIHSDAASIGSPTNSILILISDNCAASSGNICQSRWGDLTISMGNSMSDKMSRGYGISTRGVYGDRTFGFRFGTSYGSAGVGVLRETQMPATLSEGGFHTNPQQNLLNLNNESKRREAKAIWLSMLEYFGVPRPPVRTLLGVMSNLETNAAVNGAIATVRGKTYKTNTHQDTFQPYVGPDSTLGNGFYYFENLSGGIDTLAVSAPGYSDTTLYVTVIDSFFTFQNVKLVSVLPPRVLSSFPAQGQTGVLPNATLTLSFSRPLLQSSVGGNVYLLDPAGKKVAGTIAWPNSQVISFKPDSLLLMDTSYTFVVGSQVQDVFGHSFDGNGDGTPGDSLIIAFRTRTADVTAPVTLSVFPEDNAVISSENHVINITFNEPLNPATVTTSNLALLEIGASLIPLSLRYVEANNRGAINVYPSQALQPGKSYRIRVSGVADLSGNAIPPTFPLVWQFSLATSSHNFQVIDDMNSPVANWWQPSASGSTVGYDSTTFGLDTLVALPTVAQNTGSGSLRYFWRTSASDWLIREYLGGGPPRTVTWRKEGMKLQVYIHGDGSAALFRFAVDDSVDVFPSGQAVNHEVSLWTKIDWVGWRLVEWDLTNDSVGTWLGNRKLEGLLRFDSFQLTYQPGISSSAGQLRFDQLQLAQAVVTTVHEDLSVLPKSITLYQNYPNPFNPGTTIRYDIEKQGFTLLVIHDVLGRQVRTLLSSVQMPGRYSVAWDGSDDHGTKVSTGIYLLRLQHESSVLTQKMILLK